MQSSEEQINSSEEIENEREGKRRKEKERKRVTVGKDKLTRWRGPVRLSINWRLTDSASDSAPLVVFKKS